MEIEGLERRIDDLRTRVRQAAQAGDKALVKRLRAELAKVEAAWDEALAAITARRRPPPREPETPAASLVPLREQVHHALTLLTVPAAPRLISTVHGAFFGSEVPSNRFTSLRRDEEKSFRAAPYSRPYYLCPALSADRLAPVRGLLSISTWPLAARMVGPLSLRVHFLTCAISIAEAVARATQPQPEARRLLLRFAANIPGGVDSATPAGVAAAAHEELVIHEEADRRTREEAAARAAEQLTQVQRLFGSKLGPVSIEDVG